MRKARSQFFQSELRWVLLQQGYCLCIFKDYYALLSTDQVLCRAASLSPESNKRKNEKTTKRKRVEIKAERSKIQKSIKELN